jgi:superfamily I DNA/RNA helicase
MAWNDNLPSDSVAYAIATDTSSRIRVVAGPGTGKSFALKRRVARLLEEGVAPSRILAVTFTRVAAEDLHRELQGLGVEGCDRLSGKTLHSLGLRILMQQNVFQVTGRTPRPLNSFELEPLLYDISNEFGDKRTRARLVKAYEAAWARLQHEEPGYALSDEDRAFQVVLLNWLRFHKAMLIGEIVPLVYEYLRNNPQSPEFDQYDHVLVDEFQDLNKAEQLVISLVSDRANLCIVGDDDQSIYSFKHANPLGIREFRDIYPETTDHTLMDCYRCPTDVVKAANLLIQHNRDRVARQLSELAQNGNGQTQVLQYQTIEQEAAGIAQLVAMYVSEGALPSDILILAQSKALAAPILEQIRAQNIPVKSYFEESQLDSLTAQERISLFKLFIDNEDRVALRWLIGRGHGSFQASQYSRVWAYCEDHQVSPWYVMSCLENGTISIPHTRTLVERFREVLGELESFQGHVEVNDFINSWLPEGMEGVDDLRSLSLELSQESESPRQLLEKLVAEITQPEIPMEVADARIMSLYKSKGLSAPIVIIGGCVNGLMPRNYDSSKTALTVQEYHEEQRRLFYVGITRVKASPGASKPGVLVLTSSVQIDLAQAMQNGITPAGIAGRSCTLHASTYITEMGAVMPQPRRGGR